MTTTARKAPRLKARRDLSDTNLLLTITVLVFFALYLSAILSWEAGSPSPRISSIS